MEPIQKSPIQEAKELAERMEKANQERKELLDREERLRAEKILSGTADAGEAQPPRDEVKEILEPAFKKLGLDPFN